MLLLDGKVRQLSERIDALRPPPPGPRRQRALAAAGGGGGGGKSGRAASLSAGR